MIRGFLAGALGLCCMTASERAAAQDRPGPGVPLALAQERAQRITDLRYELHFTIPSAPTAPVEGTVTSRFRLTDANRPLAFDFAGAGPVRAESQNQDIPLEAGDRVEVMTPGGGGYGDPARRDPALVARDILRGYYTLAQAHDHWGKAIDAAPPPLTDRGT